jgi:hypothetical protein
MYNASGAAGTKKTKTSAVARDDDEKRRKMHRKEAARGPIVFCIYYLLRSGP